MPSLKSRLNFSLAAILVVVFVCLWGALSFSISKVAEDQLLMHLRHDRDALVAALRFDSAGKLALSEEGIEAVYRQPFSGHYFIVRTVGEPALRSPSLANAVLVTTSVGQGESVAEQVEGPDRQSVLILTQGLEVGGRQMQVSVGEDLSEMHQEVKEQSLLVLGIILPILVTAVVLQSFIVRRALHPLAEVHHALQQIGRGEVRRIDGKAPDEIRPLVDEVNRLLVLVSRRLAQSRTSIGNLAHALKTPLAVLFRVADENSLPAEVRKTLQEQTQCIRDRLERELKRARLAGEESLGSSVDLNAELAIMLKVLRSIYRDKDLKIELEVPRHPLPYDREDIVELLGNLADNACKWAHRKVAIRVADDEQQKISQFRIADDGPGCSAEAADRLETRGLRLDESVAGHGLGLAICREITDFYRGSMRIERDPELGGLAVTVVLPRRP